eukprot:GHVU01075990.1.p1 GENE.GHVU01075990.1~~GHVU01075990.1.p1  ORF type:complete len:104 (-),score=6.02 GHVU01075990.1:41-352(-)
MIGYSSLVIERRVDAYIRSSTHTYQGTRFHTHTDRKRPAAPTPSPTHPPLTHRLWATAQQEPNSTTAGAAQQAPCSQQRNRKKPCRNTPFCYYKSTATKAQPI